MTTSPIAPSSILAPPLAQSDKARGKMKAVDCGTQTETTTVVPEATVPTPQRTPSQNKLRSPRVITLANAPEQKPSDAAATQAVKRSFGQKCRAYFADKKAMIKDFFRHEPHPTHEMSEYYKGRELFRNI